MHPEHLSTVQEHVAAAVARLEARHGSEAARGFRREVAPYLGARLRGPGSELEANRHLADLESRWALIAHGLALGQEAGAALNRLWPGASSPFRRQLRDTLEALAWPDDSRSHAENLASIERLVDLLRASFESGAREEVSAGVWGEMASH